MKSSLVNISFIIIVLLLVSCGNNGTYYEQISENKTVINRVSDLNKSISEIRKSEKGKIVKEGIDFLEYEYPIGNNDSYVVSYFFDDKGCYEVSMDCYFAKKDDAEIVKDGFKNEISQSVYGTPTEDNGLYRWKNSDESVSIELDYINTDRGMLVLTIMANA